MRFMLSVAAGIGVMFMSKWISDTHFSGCAAGILVGFINRIIAEME